MRNLILIILLITLTTGFSACIKNPEEQDRGASNTRGKKPQSEELKNEAARDITPQPGQPTAVIENQAPQTGAVDLMTAAASGNTIMVTALLDTGANVNMTDNSGLTPLMVASVYGHKDTVTVLLAQGADVKAKDRTGHTALKYAELKGHGEIAELLKSHGASE